MTNGAPITKAMLDMLPELLAKEPACRPQLIFTPRDYEFWINNGHVTPQTALLNIPIGYNRSEYQAEYMWTLSEWHR